MTHKPTIHQSTKGEHSMTSSLGRDRKRPSRLKRQNLVHGSVRCLCHGDCSVPPSMSSIPAAQLISLPTYASVTNTRLKSLYSDFTYQKHSNPTSYASNIEWWRNTLEAALLRGWLSESSTASSAPDRLVLHAYGVTFADRFRVEGVGKPLSIPTVIVSPICMCYNSRAPHRCSSLAKSELCGSKALIPLSEFLSATRSIYDPGWLPYRIASFVVGKPLWWALGQLGIVESNGAVFGDSGTTERWKKVRGDYVAVSLLESAAERILERQRLKDTGHVADTLYNVESFRAEFAECALEGATLSGTDLRVVLKFLERDKGAIIVRGEVRGALAWLPHNGCRTQSRLSSLSTRALHKPQMSLLWTLVFSP